MCSAELLAPPIPSQGFEPHSTTTVCCTLYSYVWFCMIPIWFQGHIQLFE